MKNGATRFRLYESYFVNQDIGAARVDVHYDSYKGVVTLNNTKTLPFHPL